MNYIAEYKPLLDLLNALVSPFLAVVVSYIAFQQWKTNERREQRESLEIKISIYKRVKSHLSHIDSNREVRMDLYQEFLDASAEADFIFPEVFQDYLAEIDIQTSSWLDGQSRCDLLPGESDQPKIDEIEKEMERYIDELQNLHCSLYESFRRYVRV